MDKKSLIESARKQAEGYFHREELYCSEAVVHTINELLGRPYEDDVVKLASGFPVGIGKSGCLCGAITGGSMALGMVYGRILGESMSEKMFPASAALHDHIKNLYKSTCCRVLTKNYKSNPSELKAHCVRITGEVTAWVTEKLLEDPEIAEKIEKAQSQLK